MNQESEQQPEQPEQPERADNPQRLTLDGPPVHVLKTHPVHYRRVVTGAKRFELRRHDRDYRAGDFLMLCQYDPDTHEFSGDWTVRQVTLVLHGGRDTVAVRRGWSVMSLGPALDRQWVITQLAIGGAPQLLEFDHEGISEQHKAQLRVATLGILHAAQAEVEAGAQSARRVAAAVKNNPEACLMRSASGLGATVEQSLARAIAPCGLQDLREYLAERYPFWEPDDQNITVKHYCYDERIKWDTFLLCIKGNAALFIKGPLPGWLEPLVVPGSDSPSYLVRSQLQRACRGD